METFSALLALCAGNSPVTVNSPHKGQWRGALMFSLICVWINGWVNNRKAGDLRRHRGHYDVNVMIICLLMSRINQQSHSSASHTPHHLPPPDSLNNLHIIRCYYFNWKILNIYSQPSFRIWLDIQNLEEVCTLNAVIVKKYKEKC